MGEEKGFIGDMWGSPDREAPRRVQRRERENSELNMTSGLYQAMGWGVTKEEEREGIKRTNEDQ